MYKPVITLNGSFSLQGHKEIMERASPGQYTEMMREEWLNAGKPESGTPSTQEEGNLY